MRQMDYTVRLEGIEWKVDANGDRRCVADSRIYSLPREWTAEQVRDLLRDRGFRRIDNRQDSPNDPDRFE